jgi:4-oxalocrotonate tautomerase
MPIITLTIAAVPDEALSATLAKTVTDLTVAHLGKDPNLTAVAIHYLDPRHWYVGGRALAVQKTASYFIDIKVVDGSNTKTEIATWLAAVHDTLGKILNGVHPESYALVDEVKAQAYGFGGRTQEARYIARQLGVSLPEPSPAARTAS